MSFGAKASDHFSAILKTLDDKILEYGSASVSVEDQSLDFKSEFVPLFKMGTQLKVVWVQSGVEAMSFEGEVYLSSQKMLRLVALKDTVLPGASSAFTYEVSFTGNATATIEPAEEQPKRFSFLHRRSSSAPVVQKFPVSIYAISLSQIKFTCDVCLPKGQMVTLNVSQPISLKDLPLQVEVPITLGAEGTNSYRCSINLGESGYNFMSLRPYVDKLSQQKNKMFPPNPTSSEK